MKLLKVAEEEYSHIQPTQDGNFRVGDLFNVEQATGIATLNADAFNIPGLQELQLGDLALGGTSASIQEFSTDGTMAANDAQPHKSN